MPSYAPYVSYQSTLPVHPLRPTNLSDTSIYNSFLELFGIAFDDGNHRFYDFMNDRVLIVPNDVTKPAICYPSRSIDYKYEMVRGISRIKHKLPNKNCSFEKAINHIRSQCQQNSQPNRNQEDTRIHSQFQPNRNQEYIQNKYSSCGPFIRIFDGHLCSDEFLSKIPFIKA
jgi:hypothetical protein